MEAELVEAKVGVVKAVNSVEEHLVEGLKEETKAEASWAEVVREEGWMEAGLEAEGVKEAWAEGLWEGGMGLEEEEVGVEGKADMEVVLEEKEA